MKKLTSVLVLVLNCLISLACSCIGESSIDYEIKKSNVVVIGHVINRSEFVTIDKISGMQIHLANYKIELDSIYKGKVSSKEFEVITGIGGGDCGFEFEMGKRYIIYAKYKDHYYSKGAKVHKFLNTDICDRTKLEDSLEVSELLKRGKFRAQKISN